MNFFFESQFLSYLKGFCKNHSAQYALLKVSEKWKEALDKGKKVGTIFMNLSKAYIWNSLMITHYIQLRMISKKLKLL